MQSEDFIPAANCTAPEMPKVKISLGFTVLPDRPIWCLASKTLLSTKGLVQATTPPSRSASSLAMARIPSEDAPRPTATMTSASAMSMSLGLLTVRSTSMAERPMASVISMVTISPVALTEKIDLIINIEPWDVNKAYDRMGLENQTTEILDLKIPSLTIPVKPGRNLAVIIEVAAMNSRQKKLGYNAAEDLLKRLGMSDEMDIMDTTSKPVDPF